MANLTSTLTVRLLDLVSGPARAAAASLLGIGNAAAAANARAGVGALGASLATISRNADRAATRMRALATQMNSFSLPLAVVGAFGARTVYQFERVANAVQAVTNITAAQRDQLQRYAQSLNALFPLNNTQIMQAAFELGRAGLNFQQIMGSLRGTLNLSLAGDIGTQEAADIATNVLVAMRMPMRTTEQAAASLTQIIDSLAYAATRSNTDVRLMGETFKFVGPMAAAAGMSINDVTAAAMIMANSGIRGSEAGVAMRSALVRMVRPTRAMSEALARLNIDMSRYVQGGRQISAQNVIDSLAANAINAAPFSAQIEQILRDPALQSSLSGMVTRLAETIGPASIMDRTELARILTDTLTAAGSSVDLIGFFGALRERGVGVAEIARLFDVRQGARLITLQVGDLATMVERINREAAGAAERMSRIRMQGIVGTWDAFTASIENLVLAISRSGVLETVTGMIKGLTEGIESLAKTHPAILRFATYGLMIAAVVGPLGLVLAGVLSFVKGMATIGAWMTGAGLATAGTAAVGAGTAGTVGAGVAGAAVGRLGIRGLVGRLGLLGATWLGADAIWRGSGAADAVTRALTPDGQGPGTLAGAPDALNLMTERWNAQAAHQARLDGIVAELSARQAATGAADPAMLAPRPDEISRLGDAYAAADAAGQTFSAFRVRALEELRQTRAMIERETAAMIQALNFTASP